MSLKNGGKQVLVVLDGVQVSTKKNGGVGPLRYALRNVVAQRDVVLVVVIFSAQAPTPSPCNHGSRCCLLRDDKSCPSLVGEHGDTYIKFLYGEINRKTDAHMDIFRPYYEECKINKVKFVVKIAASYQPKAIILEETNNIKAKWILIMDRSFADDHGFEKSGINSDTTSLILVSDAEGLELQNVVPSNNQPQPSIVREVECNGNSSKLKAKEDPNMFCSLPNIESQYQPFLPCDHASTSRQHENRTLQDSDASELVITHNTGYLEKASDASSRLSLGLGSWEVISDITSEFKNIICDDQNENFEMFKAYSPALQSEVLVKTFTVDFKTALEAEKAVACSMHHKNILGLIGYNQNVDAISLIFPYTTQGTLERFLYGARREQWQLTFHDKMNIAIGIGQGLRYMHEECPQAPVVHGNLGISNIFLQYNLTPQITGFGHAIWVQKDQLLPSFRNRYQLDPESIKLLAADVLSFGILLLRLVCKRSIPQENRMLIKWAQPLLLERAYHKMLDEEKEYPDMYGIFRLMTAAAQCIKSRHTARPSISEVVSFLKGETSCDAEASVLSDGSSSNIMDLGNVLNH